MNDFLLQASAHPLVFAKPRVAVLVDGDNISHNALAEITLKAAQFGDPVIHRVYGDMLLHKDWAVETTYLAIHCTSSSGKNRADIHLVIGALDIAHRGLATHFLIMSNDRDFGPLAMHLREIGMQVSWAVKPRPEAKPNIPVPVPAKPMALGGVDKRLNDILKSAANGLNLQSIGSQMKNFGTVKSQTGKTTWRAYLKSKPDLYRSNGAGAATMVALKSSLPHNSAIASAP